MAEVLRYTPPMTVRDLETDWLSLRSWLTRCVLPSSLCLIGVLLLFRMVTTNQSNLNHNALIVGFFALYFVLIRGGHLIMIRSLHKELKTKYQEAYSQRLAAVSKNEMRRHNLGFTLTRIKRELIETRR